ncbi:MAG TPA: hypothetical protein DCR27_05295 [Lachnospiraceae bacterium]|nr:hypothetical protein [Lachnospiraceae bacterium]
MAKYINGAKMATTNAEIKCMFEMAKEVFRQTEKEKVIDALNRKEQEFAEVILEGKYPDKVISTIAGGKKFSFSITNIWENKEETAFQVKGSVLLPEKYEVAALHMMAVTYNADGPLQPVGLADTVFAEDAQEAVENMCTVRKALLDAWHLGIMMTLAVINGEDVEVVSRFAILNEEQNAFYEGRK